MALAAHPDEGERFGRYRLIEQIGAGGMAVVYRATTQTATGEPRSVVIKRVLPQLSRDPVFVKMLVAEARLSSRLTHPGIVQVHELGCVGGEYFLAMEFVDGVDLVRLLNRCLAVGTPLPIGLACQIVREVAGALAYAHDLADGEGRPLEIVHRDVSPANIMVTADGRTKLLDFGVAKAAEHVRDDRTRTGTLKGKINYLSPEQAEGLPIDRRSDLFALGIVLHECLTLKRLFRGDSDLVTLRMIRQCEVAPPSTLRPGLPAELDAVVLKLLARDPAQRYACGREVAAALEPLTRSLKADPAQLQAFLSGLGTIAPPPTAPDGEGALVEMELESGPTAISVPEREAQPPAKHGPRRGRPVALFGGTALLLVGGAAVALWAGRPARTVAAPAPIAPLPAPPAPTPRPAAPAAPPPVAAPTPRVSHLLVEVDVPEAHILLDGQVVADAVHRATIPVEGPGPHLLQVIAPRHRPYRRTITVSEGADLEVRVAFTHGHSTAHSATRPRQPDGDYLVDPFKSKP